MLRCMYGLMQETDVKVIKMCRAIVLYTHDPLEVISHALHGCIAVLGYLHLCVWISCLGMCVIIYGC